MSPIFSFLLLFLFVNPAYSRSRHDINLPSTSDLLPSSLAWDPSLQHFLVGSCHLPLISVVSDAGVIQPLVSDSSSSSSYVSAIAVDESRRRLIAVFSSPPTISAFDLRSPPPLRFLFSSPLSNPASSAPSHLFHDLASISLTTCSASSSPSHLFLSFSFSPSFPFSLSLSLFFFFFFFFGFKRKKNSLKNNFAQL